MKTLIVCHSQHHGSTARVGRVIADEMEADVLEPGQVDADVLARYDVVGFGSGIYQARVHPEITRLASRLGPAGGKRAFMFTTAGNCCTEYHQEFLDLLRDNGFKVVGEFTCEGQDDYRFPGTCLNEGRPDAADLERARVFARDLKRRVSSG